MMTGFSMQVFMYKTKHWYKANGVPDKVELEQSSNLRKVNDENFT